MIIGVQISQFMTGCVRLPAIQASDILSLPFVCLDFRDTLLFLLAGVQQFLYPFHQVKCPLTELEDENWLYDLGFMIDIIKHLNDLNV